MNSDIMRDLRTSMLNGVSSEICSSCHYEDSNNKVSGRLKQLLKSAINVTNFDKSFCSSPHWPLFDYSANNQGMSDYPAVDLQIDLGNTCNSACVMCSPTYSSKLATDYTTLNLIDPQLFKKYNTGKNWADDTVLIDKFVNEISTIPNIKYIHFLGGETLYLKSFYSICDKLIELGYSKNISIGTTTNCTVYNTGLERIIREFKHVHLGLSIETFHPMNNYIRYPGDIDQIRDNIERFLNLRNQTELHLALRITPNILSIYHLDSIFKFMLDNKIVAESCNILYDPSCLRVELLPDNIRREIIVKIDKIIADYQLVESDEIILNRRRDDLVENVISSLIFEYRKFLSTYNHTSDVNEERCNLVKFLKSFETLRNNSILEYLPEYEEFLRSSGY
jgi:hypothetical protein